MTINYVNFVNSLVLNIFMHASLITMSVSQFTFQDCNMKRSVWLNYLPNKYAYVLKKTSFFIVCIVCFIKGSTKVESPDFNRVVKVVSLCNIC